MIQITDLYYYWDKLENMSPRNRLGNRLGKHLGRWLFNRIIRFINPYTGALKADITELRKGYARLELKDRHAIRNHLNSIHAIALTNLGEYSSGLALISLFNNNIQGIPVEIKIDFTKKARGTLIAESTTQLPIFETETVHTVTSVIKDDDCEVVASVSVKWKLRIIQE